MFSTNESSAFDSHGAQPWAQSPVAHVPAVFTEKTPGFSEIYAAAWGIARRDHELDKLFNVEYYQGGDA